MSIYSFSAKGIDGELISLELYRGRTLLIVNTASGCGFTPQYEGLQSLYERYSSRGLTVLGFPSNQFANQESGSESEIKRFCSINYGVSFPLFQKIDVNGAKADPLFKWLKKELPGFLGIPSIKWNFTKFLIDRDGKPIKRFAPTTTPESLEKDLLKLLD